MGVTRIRRAARLAAFLAAACAWAPSLAAGPAAAGAGDPGNALSSGNVPDTSHPANRPVPAAPAPATVPVPGPRDSSAALGRAPDTARAPFRTPAHAVPQAAFRFAPPAFTRLDSLFLAAATGEPRFQPLRDSAQKILVAGDTATLDYLLANRLAGQTPRQRHYVETLFKAISDSGRHPQAAQRLGAALAAAPDSLKPQLLHIGSELGDSAFLKTARLYLGHDSEEVRKNAVRSLGSYPSPANAAWLAAGLEQTRDLERAERLWALGRQKGFPDWPKVLPVLADSNLYNRELARRIVSASCGDWSNVEKLAPSPMSDDELLEWILMAEESPGLSAKIWVRKHVPLLSPARMKFIGSALRLQ